MHVYTKINAKGKQAMVHINICVNLMARSFQKKLSDKVYVKAVSAQHSLNACMCVFAYVRVLLAYVSAYTYASHFKCIE